MAKIKSLEDLKKVREEALQKREAKLVTGQKQITVGMGTVGIAAGARETLKAILDYVETNNLSDIVVRQAGNVGLDSWEPIVQVTIGENPQVTYGKVTPDIVREIMDKHIVGGETLKKYVIEA